MAESLPYESLHQSYYSHDHRESIMLRMDYATVVPDHDRKPCVACDRDWRSHQISLALIKPGNSRPSSIRHVFTATA